jgi:hypothetical protein
MVRIYCRKTDRRGKLSEGDIQHINSQSRRKCNIPRTMLLSRIQRGIDYKITNKGGYKPSFNEMEQELKLHNCYTLDGFL